MRCSEEPRTPETYLGEYLSNEDKGRRPTFSDAIANVEECLDDNAGVLSAIFTYSPQGAEYMPLNRTKKRTQNEENDATSPNLIPAAL